MRRVGYLLLSASLISGCAGVAKTESVTELLQKSPASRPKLTPYEKGKQHLQLKQYGLAVAAFQEELQANPSSVSALNGLAIAYDRLGRQDVSQQLLDKALGADPNSAVTLNNLAYLNLTKGNTELALAYSERAKSAIGSMPDMPPPPAIAAAVARTEMIAADVAANDADAMLAAMIDMLQAENPTVTRVGLNQWELHLPAFRPEASHTELKDMLVRPVVIQPALVQPKLENLETPAQDASPEQDSSAAPSSRNVDAIPKRAPARAEITSAGLAPDAPLVVVDPAAVPVPAPSVLAMPASPDFVTVTRNRVPSRVAVTSAGLAPNGPLVVVDPAAVPVAAPSVLAMLAGPDPVTVARNRVPSQAAVTSAGLTPNGPLVVVDPAAVSVAAPADVKTALLTPMPNEIARPQILLPALPTPEANLPPAAFSFDAPIHELPTVAPPALVTPPDVRLASVLPLRNPPEITSEAARPAAPAAKQIVPAAPPPASAPAAVAAAGEWSLQIPSGTSVRVSNGAGRNLMAARFSRYLRQHGVVVRRVANAASFKYKASVIFYNPQQKDIALELASKLPFKVKLIEAKRGAGWIEVVLGSDLLAFDAKLRTATVL